ncbi:hypothetical protein LINPERHAP2_LOCUS30497, partial [Linum perenne]
KLDSRATLALISDTRSPSHQHVVEVLSIRNLLLCYWNVTFSHTYREGNQAADYLAELGHGLSLRTHLIDTAECNLLFPS